MGNGAQAGGLTVSGGATTTGNAYFAGNVGIGITTTNGKRVSVYDNADQEKLFLYHNSDTAMTGNLGMINLATDATASTENYFLLARTDWNGAVDTEFYMRGDGNAAADGSWGTGNTDYAEYVLPKPGTTPDQYPKGSLICLVTTDPDTYGFCDGANDKDVVGIVSTSPGVLGNSPALNEDETPRENTHIALAMLGRVPLRVNLDGGPITIGDRLAASSKPGVAMKATTTARTVGFALDAFDRTATSSSVMAYIGSELTLADSEIDILAELAAFASSTTPEAQWQEGSFIARFFATLKASLIAWFGDAANGITDFFAKIGHFDEVHANKLCAGSTCITETQLAAVLSATNQTPTPPTPQGNAREPALAPTSAEPPPIETATSTAATSSQPTSEPGTSPEPNDAATTSPTVAESAPPVTEPTTIIDAPPLAPEDEPEPTPTTTITPDDPATESVASQ